MKIYTVTMEREENREGHHYLIGAYTDLAKAVIEGLEHERHRADKYETRIELASVDSDDFIKEVPRDVFIDFARLKHPERFDANKHLIEASND